MRLSIKEKAGIVDASKIFEGLHLSKEFIRNMALHPESIERELKDISKKHFGICDKCRKEKDSYLPLEDKQI